MKLSNLILLCLTGMVFGCQSNLPLIETATPQHIQAVHKYQIAPGDNVQILVWRNPELSITAAVRPDGYITFPLIGDVKAVGKTTVQLSGEMKQALSAYLRDPEITVMMTQFVGNFDENIRIIGEAAQPQAIPYRDGMSILDVMIMVGGLTEFADGNRAKLVRKEGNQQHKYRVRLDDLLQRGDIVANALVYPGDVIIIPEAYF